MMTVEDARASFRPERITTLFVAESAPVGGTFFYYGNGHLGRYLRRAVETIHPADGDFLEHFRSLGWFLDDLVLLPVNHLNQRDRNMMRRSAQESLGKRIAAYRPLAIVCLMQGIAEIVRSAAAEGGFTKTVLVVPFPGNGQQRRFHERMMEILPGLPRAPIP